LPIGGTSPGEIAISILAEVVGVRNGKPVAVAV
jgi:xanthine/CO dehydrogenase XdhC/CoxF family maturation factor